MQGAETTHQDSRKKVLWSLLSIGAVVAIVGAIVSLATFTDSDEADITVQAGEVTLAVTQNDQAISETLVVDTDSCSDQNMGPGETCDYTVTVSNAGSLWFSLETDIEADANNPNGCFSADWNPEPLNGPANLYDPDDQETANSSEGTVEVTLDENATSEECAGESATFTVEFTATYAAAP